MFGLYWCHVTGQRTEEWWGRVQQPDVVGSWAQGLRCLGRGTCLCVGAWLEPSIRVHTWHRLKLNVCVVYVFVTTVMFVRFHTVPTLPRTLVFHVIRGLMWLIIQEREVLFYAGGYGFHDFEILFFFWLQQSYTLHYQRDLVKKIKKNIKNS